MVAKTIAFFTNFTAKLRRFTSSDRRPPQHRNIGLVHNGAPFSVGIDIITKFMSNAAGIAILVPLLFLFNGTAGAVCSITLASPAASATWTGYSGNTFTSTNSGCTTPIYKVQYFVDGYAVRLPGTALSMAGVSVIAPFSLAANSFQWMNGTHSAYAVGYDALENSLATSTANSFTIANTWPVSSAPTMTVATGTSLGSNWSGSVSITPTISASGDSVIPTWYLDGQPLFVGANATNTSPSFSIDTTRFYDGPHIPCVTFQDKTSGTTYPVDGAVSNEILQWCAAVTFAQGSPLPAELRSDVRELFLAPAATHQLAPTLYNTDTSVNSSFTPVYASENTNLATVNSTGLVTAVAVGAAFASSSTKIDIMSPVTTAANLQCNPSFNCTNGTYSSASHTFEPQENGQMLNITASSSLATGIYYISSVNGAGAITLNSCTAGACSGVTGGASGSNMTFATGPTRSTWAFITSSAPGPPVYHFGAAGAILSTYTPGSSYYHVSGFTSTATLPLNAPDGAGGGGYLGLDQVYSPGFVTDFITNAGFTTLELGPTLPPNAGVAEASFISSVATNVTAYTTACPLCKFLLITDNWTKSSGGTFGAAGGLFQTTRDVRNSTWSKTALTNLLNGWNGKAFQVEGGDEYSDYGPSPFIAPITWSNGLTQISVSGTTCTASGSFSVNSNTNFIIAGSAVTNMNSVNPATYAASHSAAPFTFPCTITGGPYNSGNDPGLALNPFGIQWLNNTTGLTASANDILQNSLFTSVKSQINAANTGRPNWTFPAIGTGPCSNVYGFENPANGLADYATKYYTAFNSFFLADRVSLRALVAPGPLSANAGTNFTSSGMGEVSRWYYGCYSPTAPLINQMSSVSANYGFQGYNLTVTSFSGNTLTFSAPHNLPNIIPGVSRVQLSGMSTTADNGNYLVLATPTPTTMTVAQFDTACNGGAQSSGGTLTFLNDSYSPATLNHVSLSAGNVCGTTSGSNNTSGRGSLCGPFVSYTGSVDPNVNAHRGQQFTIAGSSGGACSAEINSSTWILDIANPQVSITNGSGGAGALRFHKIPIGSSSSGTATVIADMNFIPGRNGYYQQNGSQDPDFTYAGMAYNSLLGGAGTRLYGFINNLQAYNYTAGGYSLTTNLTVFADSTVAGGLAGGANQLYLNPHFEIYYAVQIFWAAAHSNLLRKRFAAYALTTRLNSPDAGSRFECTARSGSIGNYVQCINFTNSNQSITLNTAPYLQSGQRIVQFIGSSQAIKMSTINSGTTSVTTTVPQGGEVVLLFPVSFASELLQPVVGGKVATNATHIAVRFGYDPYLLDVAGNVVDLGTTGVGMLPADLKVGKIYYCMIQLDAGNVVKSIGDVQVVQ